MRRPPRTQLQHLRQDTSMEFTQGGRMKTVIGHLEGRIKWIILQSGCILKYQTSRKILTLKYKNESRFKPKDSFLRHKILQFCFLEPSSPTHFFQIHFLGLVLVRILQRSRTHRRFIQREKGGKELWHLSVEANGRDWHAGDSGRSWSSSPRLSAGEPGGADVADKAWWQFAAEFPLAWRKVSFLFC